MFNLYKLNLGIQLSFEKNPYKKFFNRDKSKILSPLVSRSLRLVTILGQKILRFTSKETDANPQ